jgi:hypothetical protein
MATNFCGQLIAVSAQSSSFFPLLSAPGFVSGEGAANPYECANLSLTRSVHRSSDRLMLDFRSSTA